MSAARDRVLATATKLFHREGIRAVGVDRIAAEANVGKMTLYRHFATKDELVVAVLEARDGPARAALTVAMEHAGDDDARARLLAPFAMLEPWLTSRSFRGCPFMNASLELHDPGHPARAVARRHKAATRDAFAAAARAVEGIDDPDALADQLALLFDGAIAQAQMRDPATVARAALAAARALIPPPRLARER